MENEIINKTRSKPGRVVFIPDLQAYICVTCNVIQQKLIPTILVQRGKKKFRFCEYCLSYFCVEHLTKCRIDHNYPSCTDCKKDKNERIKQKHKCNCSPDCKVLIPITDYLNRPVYYAPNHHRKHTIPENAICSSCNHRKAQMKSRKGNEGVLRYYCIKCYRHLIYKLSKSR